MLSGLTLAVDVGGSGIKTLLLQGRGEPEGERERLATPRPATPDAVLQCIVKLANQRKSYERISVGFPGVVVDHVVHTAPNLDGKWAGFPLGSELSARLDRPVRVANDADVQGLGAIEGKGVELVLTLGTGMGSALFIDGRLVPNLELGHHPLTKSRTYEDYVGRAGLKKVGTKRWSKRVLKVLEQVQPLFNPRVIYLGGGNAKKLKVNLPKNVQVVPNTAGLLGGLRLWLDN